MSEQSARYVRRCGYCPELATGQGDSIGFVGLSPEAKLAGVPVYLVSRP